MGITRFNIGKTKIVLVGKYRYSEEQKKDLISRHTTWNKWSLGLWFKRSKVVGAKNFKNPKKWGQNLVNDYMLGIDLLIFQGWINWNRSAMVLKIDEHKKQKKDVMMYEKVASNLINEYKVDNKMSEEDIILEIYNETKKLYGKKKARYYFKVDKDYLPDAVSEIKERLKYDEIKNR